MHSDTGVRYFKFVILNENSLILNLRYSKMSRKSSVAAESAPTMIIVIFNAIH